MICYRSEIDSQRCATLLTWQITKSILIFNHLWRLEGFFRYKMFTKLIIICLKVKWRKWAWRIVMPILQGLLNLTIGIRNSSFFCLFFFYQASNNNMRPHTEKNQDQKSILKLRRIIYYFIVIKWFLIIYFRPIGNTFTNNWEDSTPAVQF